MMWWVIIGVEFASKNIVIDENYRVKLQIWDTAGQESFQAIVKSFYRSASAVILVYNITKYGFVGYVVRYRLKPSLIGLSKLGRIHPNMRYLCWWGHISIYSHSKSIQDYLGGKLVRNRLSSLWRNSR